MIILSKKLDGENKVVLVSNEWFETESQSKRFTKFSDFFQIFINRNGYNFSEGINELGQVLKIPFEQLLELHRNEGYITPMAMQNLERFLQSRKSIASIVEFMQGQYGEAGMRNKYEVRLVW